MRHLTSLIMVVVAILLLGALVTLSTNIDDEGQRSLDQTLGHMRDLGLAVERESLNARNLGVDNGERLQALTARLDTGLGRVGENLAQLYPDKTDVYVVSREKILHAYNYMGATGQRLAKGNQMGREFAALDQAVAWLNGKTNSFTRNHTNFLAHQKNAANIGRQLSQELREQSKATVADRIFQSVQQVLTKSRRGSENDLAQIEAVMLRLQENSPLLLDKQQEALFDLVDHLEQAVPLRRAMEQDLQELSSGRFLRQVTGLKELVTKDYLYRLNTINESRILLIAYTIMLLLVLVYFGIRLQRSYRSLNQSHEELEERVQDRTRDLESAYKDLSESQVQLVQAEKMSSLGQLVAGVMHEINTPLLYIRNNAQMVATNIEEVNPILILVKEIVDVIEQPNQSSEVLNQKLAELSKLVDTQALKETLEEITQLTRDNEDGLEQITELVQSLKDFSRLDRAKEDRFDVREGLEKTLVITRNMLKHGVEVEKRFHDVPDIVCAPSRINQIFINLITNAVQAMNGTGKLILSTQLVEDCVEVAVRDTGCGIAEEHMNKVMDPFFTTKPVGQGTGLGLSIVSQIVDEHGGSMQISSRVDVGTCIRIRLPVAANMEAHGDGTIEAA